MDVDELIGAYHAMLVDIPDIICTRCGQALQADSVRVDRASRITVRYEHVQPKGCRMYATEREWQPQAAGEMTTNASQTQSSGEHQP